jgi:CheY-like chemotaxis protein
MHQQERLMMSSLKDKKLLIVDDEEGIRELLISELDFHGAICTEASSGKEAFDLYKTQTFDAVISDIRMSNGDGLFFLEEIRKANLPLCTMIFMTGFSEIPLAEFYDRGVEAVISKPFRLEQILNTLEVAINSPRMGWRRVPRIVAVLSIEVLWAGLVAPIKAKTFNIGRGGIFVQSAPGFYPKLGSRVKFTLYYTSEGREDSTSGEMVVRWIREEADFIFPSGFGAEFAGLDQEKMALIAGLAPTQVYIPKT